MSLCLSCGFCCDGTLFEKVPLGPHEAAEVRAAVGVAKQQASLLQPCAALNGTCCRVYTQRPLACRRYRCLLLEAHETGEVSLEGAQAVVELVRRARLALSTALGVDDAGPVVHQAKARAQTLTEPERAAVERLEHLLRFHFAGHRWRAGLTASQPPPG